ncbi:YqgQ family protein [Falsibacillus albus]|uniref:DUF910 family protein n=1 Tax=Falsibacillus albus TaxID=2478915 RepID=A0A3L7K588_9BACI|nr:YqgQ family protein [Falsibacillus albus]RLQ98233.1 DUF910 family protein [Falsibacillus albus]
MKTVYDVQQFLKRYGTIIYTGDRLADLELMEMEFIDLFQAKVIDPKDFQSAILVIKQHIQKEKQNLKNRGE